MSRNKNVLLSTPYVFQRQLSDFFCLETRLNLRKCSKRCQSLVDNMPLTLEKLDISVTVWVTILLTEPKLGIKNTYSYPKILTCIDYFRKKDSEKCAAADAVRDLKIILCNPNLQIEKMYLDIGKGQLLFLQHLVSMVTSLPHQIHVQNVYLIDNLSPEDCRALLSCLKPEKLQAIKLEGQTVDGSLNELSVLKQIEQVPAICIYNQVDHFPFNLLSNTSEFAINLKYLSQTEFNQIIELFLQRDNFKKGYLILERIEPWLTQFLSKNQAVKNGDGKMIATFEGPKFKNTVEVGEEGVVFRRIN